MKDGLINTSLICTSEYITLRDGVRLAVSSWLPGDEGEKIRKRPALVISTRYWRAQIFKRDNPELQPSYPSAVYFRSRGYILVIADARGSGASFGSRETEMSPTEIEDIGELIDWVAGQSWCDGRVATTGTSYTANTTLYSLVTSPSALKMAVCRAPDFDGYRHLLAPGGVVNHWFVDIWGKTTEAQDSNDVKALMDGGYWPLSAEDADNLLGVRPVDGDWDGELLTEAISEHSTNFNLAEKGDRLTFVDTKPFGSYLYLFDPEYKEKIERSNVPVVIRCGWHDAGTALGALSMFTSFKCPMRVILGPWSHGGDFRADPFQTDSATAPEVFPVEELCALTAESLDRIFKESSNEKNLKPTLSTSEEDYFGTVEYYTLGENRWKTTQIWPLPESRMQRIYLAEGHRLSINQPLLAEGSDRYCVDATAGTGLDNRWHAQTASKPILFPDRQEDDKKLLIYDTPPLEVDMEITGHPVVHLWLRSTATDGHFFVYLETIDPDGRVRMLTEGQLRGLHRKISVETPPYHMFGPYHSLKEKDAQPLTPGEVEEINFDLFPISVLLKKGQRIRLAIAGADKDVFSPIAGCETPEITVERNSIYSSHIDLPVV